MAFGTPTDHPKSVHNRYVIEVFSGVHVLSRSFSDFSVSVGVFVIRRSQRYLPFYLDIFVHCNIIYFFLQRYAFKEEDRRNVVTPYVCSAYGIF